jgi:hypothetical protein
MKSFRTATEEQVGKFLQEIFLQSSDSVEVRLENFPKYVRRQQLKRFLALYEIFKLILPVKGSIIECGIYKGFGLMSWAKLSSILEPENLTRRIYGFDSFDGFPGVSKEDANPVASPGVGELGSNSSAELKRLIEEYDKDRFLGHIDKVHLIAGDARETIPAFTQDHSHLLVSLLFMDFDLYEPTKVALEHFVPRMPRGAVLAFDELDNPIWPGETMALLDTLSLGRLKIQRLPWDPYIGFAVLD